VIHSHSFFGLGIEALVASRLLGVPVVGTNHTHVPAFAPYIPVPVERAIDWVVWYYNRCEAITAPSRTVFEGLGLARMKHRPHIVSNPIDLSVFRPGTPDDRAATREAHGLHGQVILYAGRLGAEKNIEIMLHALALMPQGPLLALAGHGAHEPALRRLAAELGVADRVLFLGTLRPAELARVFGAADLFAMMSTSETQSMASLQAMACGLPVLAPDHGALAEFVSPSTGRLVPPDDAGALSAVITDLLDDPAGRVRMGEAGHRMAQRHSVEAVSDAWENLYQSLLPAGNAAWSPT
jgi:glycosyltransferase involved in cell wall biosynthesis